MTLPRLTVLPARSPFPLDDTTSVVTRADSLFIERLRLWQRTPVDERGDPPRWLESYAHELREDLATA